MADSTGYGVYGAGIYGAEPDVVDTPPTPSQPTPADPDWNPASPGLALIGTNGDVIPLKVTDDDYIALQGATGFGIPPKVLTMYEGASDGGNVRYVRTGARDIDLPVGIVGASRGEVWERQRRFASALRVRRGKPPARLQFVLETGEIYETVVYYVSGAETQITSESGTATYARWPITLRCPDPYWTSTVETLVKIGAGGAQRGLLPHLTALQLTPAQVLGSVALHNTGDVDADLVWEIRGPGGPFTATSDTGLSFTIEDTLVDGETITVDTKTADVRDQTGRNRYTGLALAPKLFKLPDGTTTVQINLGGASAASLVTVRFRVRREVMY